MTLASKTLQTAFPPRIAGELEALFLFSAGLFHIRRQVRDEFLHGGQNLFRLEYRGDEPALRSALAGRCEVVATDGDAEPPADGAQDAAPTLRAPAALRSLTIHVADDKALHAVIAAANEAVALRSFAEEIPSMNDIFIRAVNGTL